MSAFSVESWGFVVRFAGFGCALAVATGCVNKDEALSLYAEVQAGTVSGDTQVSGTNTDSSVAVGDADDAAQALQDADAITADSGGDDQPEAAGDGDAITEIEVETTADAVDGEISDQSVAEVEGAEVDAAEVAGGAEVDAGPAVDTGAPCTPSQCDDGNPCTKETCDLALGCTSSANDGALCDDGKAFTLGDSCANGFCVSGVDTKLCKNQADCGKYEDGDGCNGTLFCNKALGVCQVNPNTVVSCPSVGNTACATNHCQPLSGKCALVGKPEQTPCDDGNLCTTGEACQAGVCKATQGADTCGCKADADCAKYEDGDICNGKLFCNLAKAKCEHNPATVVVCPTGLDTVCAKNVCDKASGACGLALAATGTLCDADGSPCTPYDYCQAGQCKADVSVCQCQTVGDCAKWEDGYLCNGTLFCDLAEKGKAKCATNPASVPAPCAATGTSPCSVQACVAATGKCATLAAFEGGACDDGVACTDKSVCVAGSCSKGAAKVCDDGQACTDDTCDAAKGCVGVANTATCTDGDACTAGDNCGGGVCLAGAASPCDDGNVCTSDVCTKALGCMHDPLPGGKACDDGLACTLGDVCAFPAGKCGGTNCCTCVSDGDCGGANPCLGKMFCDKTTACTFCNLDKGTALKCDDGSVCTDDSCNAAKGCVYQANAATCTDGNACTEGDACGAGSCVAGKAKACPIGVCEPKDGTCPAGCGEGYLAIPIDDGGVKKVVCAPEVPVWGILPLAPNTLSANNDGTVKDAATGLQWQQAPDTTKKYDWAAAGVYCDSLDLAGKKDWRLPTRTELFTIVDYTKAAPGLDAKLFPATENQFYWTSVSLKENNMYAWAVYGQNGNAQLPAKLEAWYVRCVRAQSPAPVVNVATRYAIDAKQDVVFDTLTLRVWQRTANVAVHAWADAATACQNLQSPNLNWRVPDVRELTSLTDTNRASPAIDTAAFPGVSVSQSGYWSSTSYGGSASNSATWAVSFGAGVVINVGKLPTAHPVLCVCDCNDNNPCTTDTTDPKTGACAHTPLPDTATCTDNNACTATDECVNGKCLSATNGDCFDQNPCTTDTCDPKIGCKNTAIADDTPCGTGQVCKAGGCKVGCAAGVACTDNNACTFADKCGGGVCLAGPKTNCDDGNLCTEDSCDVVKGCVAKLSANGAPCTGGTCAGGTCVLAACGSPGQKLLDATWGGPQTDYAKRVAVWGDGYVTLGMQGNNDDSMGYNFVNVVSRIDLAGKVIWSTVASGYAGLATTATAVAVAGEQWRIRKLDVAGKVTLDEFLDINGGASGVGDAYAIAAGKTGWGLTGFSCVIVSNVCKKQLAIVLVTDSGALHNVTLLGSPGDDVGNAILALPDGYLVAGNGRLVRTDLDGDKVWEQKYGGLSGITAIAAVPNGFVLAGGQLAGVDSLGKLNWAMPHTAVGLAAVADGVIAVLTTNSGTNGKLDMALRKFNGAGQLLWSRTHGGAEDDHGFGIAAAGDGVVAVGATKSKGAGLADAWIVRTDGWGFADCATAGKCASKPVESCDDKNPCTLDGCDPSAGCTHIALADGTPCDTKVCKAAVCGGAAIASITAGHDCTCAVKSDGSLWCWGGAPCTGLLGSNGPEVNVPTLVKSLTNVAAVALGRGALCVLRKDGTVSCPSSNSWITAGLTNVKAIAVATADFSNATACAVMGDDTVKCWGNNSAGQLGVPASAPVDIPVAVDGLTEVKSLAIGGGPGMNGNHVCALRVDGSVWCWGLNNYGQLGGSSGTTNSAKPLLAKGGPMVSIIAGLAHTCTTNGLGKTSCWGYNGNAETDVSVLGLQSLSTGGSASCGLKANGALICWAAVNNNLFNGSEAIFTKGGATMPIFDVKQVAVGRGHLCALKVDGTLQCMGDNMQGQLGQGKGGVAYWAPTQVVGLSDAVSVVVGDGYSCAVRANGTLKCWGGMGPSGNQTAESDPLGLANVIELAGGAKHACGLTNSGSVQCWGNSSNGQAENPIGLNGLLAVGVGNGSSCAVTAGASIACWGSVLGAKVGAAAVPVGGIGPFIAVAGGATSVQSGDLVCGLRKNGSVACAGPNVDGQLGDGAKGVDSKVFVDVENIDPPAKRLTVGGNHACVVHADGTVSCWGSVNGLDQKGFQFSTAWPEPVAGLTSVIDAAAGYDATCVVKSDATLACWGGYAYFMEGLSGKGTVGGQKGPQVVPQLIGVKQCAVGSSHICAVKNDGTVWCWGNGNRGKIGDGWAWRTTPVAVLLQ